MFGICVFALAFLKVKILFFISDIEIIYVSVIKGALMISFYAITSCRTCSVIF